MARVVRQADGALDQARDDLSAAYAQPETTQRAALELARLNLTQGDYPAAEDWARRTRELDPEGDDPDWVLAQALLGQERADEALAALAGPSERDGPRQAEALMLRGEILLARGRVDEGEDALRRASEVSDHPGAYLRLAHLYVQTGRGADAERAYTQALERTDEPAIVLVDRARFRLSTGDREGALGDARRAVELDPKHPQPRVTLGRVLFIGFQQGGEALEELRRALELQVDFPPALYASAEVLYDALNCEGALRLLDRLLQLEPTHSDGHFLRAMTHSELEDVQAAARDFDAALRLEQGRSALTFSAFATLLREHGQFHEALGLYDQALAVDPGCGPAHYGRGLCLMFARGARAEAIQALRQGLPPGAGERGVQRHWVDYLEQLPPEAPPLAPSDWLAQAEELLQREEFVSAALCFSHALDLGAGGQRGRARRGLAECLLQAGDPQAGEQELTRALWAGAGPEALLTRGLVRHARGDLQGALRDFERILQRDPAQPDALLGRGMAFAQLGELERAAGDFASYVRLVPDRPEGWSNLAVVTYKLDDCETAVQAATRALELTPDDAQLIALRGAALRKLGDLPHARADLDRVLSATPEPEGARLERMVVAQQQGDHATAIADGRLLLERDPMHLPVRMALAESLAADGQRAEALRLYDDTLERLDPAATVRAEVQRLRDQLAGAAREDE
ncbi:MAG: tetratricopeptide repeat protein [Planctomycetota bacterium]